MKTMLRFSFAILFIFALSASPRAALFASGAVPEISGETAAVLETKTGVILYDKEMHSIREPASTTKILTCLLALEKLPLDHVVVVDGEAPFTEGSRIFLFKDEEITVENLLYALMLASANDAAVALAKAVSGTVAEFSELMNQRAEELGAKNSNFKNPSGLHTPGHVTTAYDLAMIAKGAMENPEFRKLVSTYEYTIPPTNKQPEARLLHNTNRMLYDKVTLVPVRGGLKPAYYPGATGIKTGQTGHAGNCLVASAFREDRELIAVVLKSNTEPGRFGDCVALLDYGFDNYYLFHAVNADEPIESAKVRKGAIRHVKAVIQDDFYLTLPKEASAALIVTRAVLEKNLTAPIEKGQPIGKIEIYEGGDVIGEVPVLAAHSVEVGGLLSIFGIDDRIGGIILWAALALVFVAALLFLIVFFLRIRNARIRKARRIRRATEIAQERRSREGDSLKRQWPYE